MASEKGRKKPSSAKRADSKPKALVQASDYDMVRTGGSSAGHKRRKKKEPSIFKWATAGFIVLMLILLLANQIKIRFHENIRTQTAEIITVSNVIETVGWTVRNETVLSTEKTGVIVPTVDNGGKISKGEPVALIFQSADAANAYSRIAEINSSIARFTSMETAKDDTSFANSVGKQLDYRLIGLSRAIYSGDVSEIDKLENDLLYLLNKGQIATRKVENFRGRIEELEAEKHELETSFPSSPADITTSLSGYYIAGVDGYEDQLSISKLGEMTPEAFKKITEEGKISYGTNIVGKIADDYKWQIACLVDLERAGKLTLGNRYVLRLPYSHSTELTGKLVRKTEGNGSLVLLSFEITVTVPELLEVRSQPVIIVIEEYTGIGLPKDALRVNTYGVDVSMTDAQGNEYDSHHEESSPGVFVLYGSIVKFRKIKIIYELDDTYVVAENREKDWLKLYDEVIVSGKGLYDGKIIN